MPTSPKTRKHIIIIGSGIAGLIAALEISREHEVTLVTKSELAESNTRWAQGGIAVAMFPDDSVAEHVADTLRAGAGLCDRNAVEVLCSEGPARIRDLIRLGVTFDQRDGDFARGLEAAHSRPRVLHAGGDATGLSIETALVRAVRNSKVKVLEHTFACDLILKDDDQAPRVTGLRILETGKGAGAPRLASETWESSHERTLEADAVILASGGAGQLYLHTTNPLVATGDGVAIALRAGAQLADVEFYQFHPTALATPGTFLISEAVRGDGAVLLDAHGRRFMQHIHPLAELAPRDVVARGIARQMAIQNGQPVLLDATALGKEFLATRFPTIDAACRTRGFDWSKNPIPVTPAAHYWMGGVRTDIWGRTSLPGLYAVGEVACTGVHGANRLASNSLLESLVFAWRCAHLFLSEQPVGEQTRQPSKFFDGGLQVIPFDIQTAAKTTPVNRAELQTLMWNAVGIERTGDDLQTAATQLTRWHGVATNAEDLETANLLSLARVVTAAAFAREESRGAHFREDFPETSPAFQHSLVYAKVVAKDIEVPC